MVCFLSNSPEIFFSAKRVANGYLPLVDGNDPGGYFGGQKVFLNHVCKTREEATILAKNYIGKD